MSMHRFDSLQGVTSNRVLGIENAALSIPQLSSFFVALTLLVSTSDQLGISAVSAATKFTFINDCSFNVWPGIEPNAGSSILAGGGFAMASGKTCAVRVQSGWTGRFWGRSGCSFNGNGHGTCATGDCAGLLECAGAGGTPPATLVEITLNGANDDDFYDISLVDGYNLPLSITANGGSGNCGSAGCTSDLNSKCPQELQVVSGGQVVACKSACDEFRTSQYCCTGPNKTPSTCPPTNYSRIFKDACPTAYSYAYDDGSSQFTCKGASYTIIFCPNGSSSVGQAQAPGTNPAPTGSSNPAPPDSTSPAPADGGGDSPGTTGTQVEAPGSTHAEPASGGASSLLPTLAVPFLVSLFANVVASLVIWYKRVQ